MAEFYIPPPRPTAPPLTPSPSEQQPVPPNLRFQPQTHQPRPPPAKPVYDTLQIQKTVVTLTAGMLSALVIGLSYVAVFPTSDIFRGTIAPVASASVFIVAGIFAGVYQATVPGVPAKLAMLPILLSVVGGAMIVLLNVASKASSDGAFIRINISAVILSAGVFGGLGLGTTIGFVLFASSGKWRLEV